MKVPVPHVSTPDAYVAAAPLVPFLDLGAQYQDLEPEILAAWREIAASSTFVLGPRVEAFESAFAEFVGALYCIGVNSGTSALHLALLAAGVGPGDEVITVPMTFIATTWAISYLGARPVFVDIDPISYTLDVAEVERQITPRTRAIVPVHLYGQVADMGPLLELAARHGIPVVEDAAQAHGAAHGDRNAGTLGCCGAFSFYPGKNLGAYGEAGAITTDDAAIAARLRRLRDHAQSQRYHHQELGFNYRMDAFQGAVLGVKLPHLEGWTRSRERLAGRYLESLTGLPITLPTAVAGRRHAWHLFVIQHPERDRIRVALEEQGIQTGLHYPIPVHLQPAYGHLGHGTGDFPVSERLAAQCLSLPLYPELTDRQQDLVIQAVRRCVTALDRGETVIFS